LKVEAGEMKVDVCFVPRVTLRGQGVTHRPHGLLLVTVDLPPAARVWSIAIVVDPNDSNKGTVSVELSATMSIPEFRFPVHWIEGNIELAETFCNILQSRFEEESEPLSMMPYRRETKTFHWPNGQQSDIMPVDPFSVGFRPAPTP
jgi:hypothetical protein